MPVSFFPLVLPVLFVLMLTYGVTRGLRYFFKMLGAVVALMAILILPFYFQGWDLMWRASHGEAPAMYQLARWHENHAEKIGQFILWPFEPDVSAGYAELENAAADGYPPVIYTLGVRLKYGQFVPQPSNWTGPAGNVFPQPGRGQRLIDQAIKAGYRPTVPEEDFYWKIFRE